MGRPAFRDERPRRNGGGAIAPARAAQQRQIRQAWQTIQENLASQCVAMPRGMQVRRLIAELDQRLHLHLALPPRLSGLSRAHLLTRLRNLLALLPLDSSLQQAGLELLRGLNHSALVALQRHLAPANGGLVVVVTGCRTRAAKLTQTLDRFRAVSAGAAVLGVVGDSGLRDWELAFDAAAGILSLPIPDSYEALPQKVGWAALALALCPQPLAMLKVDDDATPADLHAAVELLADLTRHDQAAAGYPITTPSPLALDRGWHLGKSAGKANHTAFNNLATKHWMSGGVGYLLAPRGVEIVAGHALHTWGFFESMLYEDITISMILNAADAPLLWLKQASRLGIGSERADEIAQGLWAYDEAMLSEHSC